MVNKENIGIWIARFGVAITLLSIGLYKFTAEEAEGIVMPVSESPFMFWLYYLGSKQGISNFIGSFEIITSLIIFASYWIKNLQKVAGILGTWIFFLTLSFLFTTSKDMYRIVENWLFLPNSFIIKDIVLLGVSIDMIFNKK